MGSIITLRNEIQALIDLMDNIEYLRASPGEANIHIDKHKVNRCLAIHFDQTTAIGTNFESSVVKIIPIEILFVYKNHSLDEKLKDVDKLVDMSEDKADEFYDRLIQSSVINDLGEPTDYTLERLEGYKRFDTILSGVLFNWDAPVSRTQYFCNGN